MKAYVYFSVSSRRPIGFDGVLKGLPGFDFNRGRKSFHVDAFMACAAGKTRCRKAVAV
jgi:hypothetical protein